MWPCMSLLISCVDLGGWIFVLFWVDLEDKVSEFRDKFYES